MKTSLLILIFALIAASTHGQTHFEVNGRKLPIGTISKRYNFAFKVAGRLELVLTDSVLRYESKDRAYVKEYRYTTNGRIDSMIHHQNAKDLAPEDTLKYENSKCHIVKPYAFTNTDYATVRRMATQLLVENKDLLGENEGRPCKSFFLTLISADGQKTRLSLEHREPFWCEGRSIRFSTKEVMD